MNDLQNVSFEVLGKRELLKSFAWWLGLAITVATAVYVYITKPM